MTYSLNEDFTQCMQKIGYSIDPKDSSQTCTHFSKRNSKWELFRFKCYDKFVSSCSGGGTKWGFKLDSYFASHNLEMQAEVKAALDYGHTGFELTYYLPNDQTIKGAIQAGIEELRKIRAELFLQKVFYKCSIKNRWLSLKKACNKSIIIKT